MRAINPDKVYGPHRAEDGPRKVTVFEAERDGGDHEELIPEVLLRQRRMLNERASRTFVHPTVDAR